VAVSVSYPGVYVEEIPSGVRTISGVSTARTAFIGRAPKGPVDEPTLIFSFADYDRKFGGLRADSTMGFAVQQYFNNGGGEALIVRVFNGAAADTATIGLTNGAAAVTLSAASAGAWGSDLFVAVDHDTRTNGVAGLVNLTVFLGATEVEMLRNVSTADLQATLAQRSEYLRFTGAGPSDIDDTTPPATSADPPGEGATGGGDGNDIASSALIGTDTSAGRTGMMSLVNTDIFNILCLPPPTATTDVVDTDYQLAAAFCEDHRAMLIVDPPLTTPRPEQVPAAFATFAAGDTRKNAAGFFPRILAPNPLTTMIEEFVPCGVVAGVFARTDATRGVWKAPAGIEAGLSGVSGLAYPLTDAENGVANQQAVNCLRNFPGYGHVVWGARTLDGGDQFGSEWKYIPVRRLALYIEESLFRGLKWVVFEPNDAPLWAQIRLNVGAFMNNLFRQGAFQGAAPKDAYFVKCDSTTTTQNDINLGIVNILVGFAPLKPAEFVILKIQQIAGQIQT
jgi:phage tail sheath protein FI